MTKGEFSMSLMLPSLQEREHGGKREDVGAVTELLLHFSAEPKLWDPFLMLHVQLVYVTTREHYQDACSLPGEFRDGTDLMDHPIHLSPVWDAISPLRDPETFRR
ncbi:unnamed protein product [Eretmochelys imbricata]